MTEPRRDPIRAARELDPRLIKAISHPLRYRLLVRLHLGEASPVVMARELDEPVGRVSHHVRTLAGVGAIELVRTVPRRGAVEHFYRAVIPAWFTDSDWESLPPTTRQAIVDQNVHDVVSDVAAAARTGFERPGIHLSRTPLSLDDDAFGEVARLLNATLERIMAIQEESRRRAARPTAETEVVLMHFERQ